MQRICFAFLAICILMYSTMADERDHYEGDSEFADDMMEDIDLREEVDSIPEWSIPTENDKDNRQVLLDYYSKLSIELKQNEKDKKQINKQTMPFLRDATFDEIGQAEELRFYDTNIKHSDGIQLPKKNDFQFSNIENAHHRFKELKDDLGRSQCPRFPTSSAASSMITCGSTYTELGLIRWCRFECKQGYRLKNFYPKYEICGRATKYRWSYELKGFRSPTERCASGESQSFPEPCTSPQCFATAAYYINKIDYSVNPCDNFFDFACGRWNKESKIPASQTSYETYSIIRNRVNLHVADLIDKLDAEPLLEFLRGDLAWPIIDPSWSPNQFNFESTVAALRGKYNSNYIMTINVGAHNGIYMLEVLKGKLPLPFSYYVKKKFEWKLDSYYLLIYDTAVMLGADPARALLDVAEMKKFEMKLAKYKKEYLDIELPMTIRKLQSRVPQINWLQMIRMMITSHPIARNTPIIVWSESYLKRFVKLVQATDKRVIQNYMVWTTVKYRIKNLSSRFQSRFLRYESEVYGVEALSPQNVKCSLELMLSMKAATSKMFIDNYFNHGKKEAAKEMFDFIRKGFLYLLDNEVDWMDKKTKSYAEKKAKAIKSDVGFNPHLYQNMTYLNESVQKLLILKSDYFGNYVRVLEKSAQTYFSKLGQYHNASVYSFDVRATMVNAFYNSRHNTMVLPGGELQYPLYWGATYPRVLNFGAIGTILGHELTHGFDIVGRKFDIDGNVRNWWTSASLEEFKKRVNCLKVQYDNFYWKTAEDNLDGKKDMAENIADNGGIRESFAGYKLWLKSKNLSSEPVQPATGFTNEQMFFIAFANDRCGHFTHEGAARDLADNPHSPGRFRVIGSLQNFEVFSKVFNCPVGSYMNPPNKCIIW